MSKANLRFLILGLLMLLVLGVFAATRHHYQQLLDTYNHNQEHLSLLKRRHQDLYLSYSNQARQAALLDQHKALGMRLSSNEQ